ncbi:puratrophin-1 [Ornithorhynchus anatinus]|uniref:puratrophin-1 n=1 Tax=Ornithorhynchus anatinus TaxID=9258 RepID=UPI0010A77A29|nr:puratrophin-1 [Ornithorhynchus anatinus]
MERELNWEEEEEEEQGGLGEWGSVDSCVQATLAALYPPWEASAAVLLGQVLAVVERAYAGDGLRYLLDFLVPGGRVLQFIQQHACGQYQGRLFAHAGWPLCLGEQVVVQLASLDWRLLRPGDFYLQLVPFLRRRPRLVLTCLAPSGHGARQLPLPEATYSAVFTGPWLGSLNAGRAPGAGALHSCLLAVPDGQVLRVPWEEVLKPCFLDEPGRHLVETPRISPGTAVGAVMSLPAPSSSSPQSLPDADRDSASGTLKSPTQPLPSSGPGLGSQGGSKESIQQGGPLISTTTETPMVDSRAEMSRPLGKEDGRDPEGSRDADAPRAGPLGTCGHAVDQRFALCSLSDTEESPKGSLPPSRAAAIAPTHTIPPRSLEASAHEACGPAGPAEAHSGAPQGTGQQELLYINPSNPPSGQRDRLDPRDPNRLSGSGRVAEFGELEKPSQPTLVMALPSDGTGDSSGEGALGSTDQLGRALPAVSQHTDPQLVEPSRPLAQNREEDREGAGLCQPVGPPSWRDSNSPGRKQQRGQDNVGVNPGSAARESESPDMCPLIPSGAGSCSTQLPRNFDDPEQKAVCETPTFPGACPSGPSEQAEFPTLDSSSSTVPIMARDLPADLLASRVATLPGTRDKSGRAVVLISGHSPAWSSPHCSAHQLARLLLYLYSIPRPEVQELGLTVLMDFRRCCPPGSTFFSALGLLQEMKAGCVHKVLLLGVMQGDKPRGLQLEVVPSCRALLHFIPGPQLPLELDGSLPYDHDAWLHFRTCLESLLQSCQDVCALLQSTIKAVAAAPEPEGPGATGQPPLGPQALIQRVLEDPRLGQLQKEGGATLARLKWGHPALTQSPDYRSAVDMATQLYGQVDVLLHQLVTLCNRRLRALELAQKLGEQAGALAEVSSWIEQVGRPWLDKLPRDEEMLLKAQDTFWELDRAAQKHCGPAEAALAQLSKWETSELGELGVPGAHLLSLRAQQSDFMGALNQQRQRLGDAVRFFHLLDQALAWAQEGQRVLAGLSGEDPGSTSELLAGQGAQRPTPGPAHFHEMEALAGQLGSGRALQQCHVAWTKCQDTQVAVEAALIAQQVLPKSDRLHGDPHSGGGSSSSSSNSSMGSISCLLGGEGKESQFTGSAGVPWCPGKLPLKKTQSFELALREKPQGRCHRTLSEPVHHGNVGVTIRGLEVSTTRLARPPHSEPPDTHRALPGGTTSKAKNPGRLQLIMEEMVATEREYVSALEYTVRNYVPELERPDLPQPLRGQRARLFGNLEKLSDFHRNFFLRELESCAQHPLRVANAFLRHREQFGMYALYTKNKPKSDVLMASHGNAFFKKKQQQLGDRLDLASYLLKPIQRMSKYALLLRELARACGEGREQGLEPEAGAGPKSVWGCKDKLATLQAAHDLVRFQLRHGNDLLAMDAISGCDVNLKEQGQLLRQDEFTIWGGRRKCRRRVFLFEELVLFSKPRRAPAGTEAFAYKRSFKTADIGLTESAGDSGLRFEIWFRRRKASDTFVLQAASADIKQAWTMDISSLLWRQAVRNKELRMAEMMSMGVGNKPFLDITPSEAAINDRSVDYIMKGRGPRTRASIAVSLFDHSSPYPGAPSSLPTSPSSCSLLGPLNLHLSGDPALLALGRPLCSTACLEEDETEPATEIGGQPSLTLEGFEISSQSPSASGSTGSDSSCVPGLPLGSSCEEQLTSQPESRSSCSHSQYISAV